METSEPWFLQRIPKKPRYRGSKLSGMYPGKVGDNSFIQALRGQSGDCIIDKADLEHMTCRCLCGGLVAWLVRRRQIREGMSQEKARISHSCGVQTAQTSRLLLCFLLRCA